MARVPISACAVATACLTSAAGAQPWEVVWSDEFDGTTLNLENWEPQIGDGQAYGLPSGWGNNEVQWYTDTPDNIEVSNGTLKIIARDQNVGNKQYSSARLRTRGLQEFKYGRIEARIKLPSAQGAWPAFWMLPTDSPYGGWAASGEIDIMESVNNADRIYGTLHFGGQWPENTSTGGSVPASQVPGVSDFGDDFHVYTIEWDPGIIRWFVDGQLYSTKTDSQWFTLSGNGNGNDFAPFDTRFHLLMNLALGGDFPQQSPNPADFPLTMEVDWVRVSAPPQLPSLVLPLPIPGQVQAEQYDDGLLNQAYFDSDDGNNGGAWRTDDVDVQVSSEGGFNIGWIREGEWTEYTVNVAEAGVYDVEARVASAAFGAKFRLEFDGEDKTGQVDVPFTGGFQNWTTVTAQVSLDAGEQIMRFTNLGNDTEEFNVSWWRFTLVTPPDCTADLNGDGSLNNTDINLYVNAFLAEQVSADLNGDGSFNNTDINLFVNSFLAGCG